MTFCFLDYNDIRPTFSEGVLLEEFFLWFPKPLTFHKIIYFLIYDKYQIYCNRDPESLSMACSSLFLILSILNLIVVSNSFLYILTFFSFSSRHFFMDFWANFLIGWKTTLTTFATSEKENNSLFLAVSLMIGVDSGLAKFWVLLGPRESKKRNWGLSTKKVNSSVVRI